MADDDMIHITQDVEEVKAPIPPGSVLWMLAMASQTIHGSLLTLKIKEASQLGPGDYEFSVHFHVPDGDDEVMYLKSLEIIPEQKASEEAS